MEQFNSPQYNDVIDYIENTESVLDWNVLEIADKVETYFNQFCKLDGFEPAAHSYKIKALLYFQDVIYNYEWEQEDTARLEMLRTVKDLG